MRKAGIGEGHEVVQRLRAPGHELPARTLQELGCPCARGLTGEGHAP